MNLKKFDTNKPAYELFDNITIWTLKDAYRVSKLKNCNANDDDRRYNKNLRAALKIVLAYFGEKP